MCREVRIHPTALLLTHHHTHPHTGPRETALRVEGILGGRVPPFPGTRMRKASSTNSLLHLTSATGPAGSTSTLQPPPPAGSPTYRGGAGDSSSTGGGPFSASSGAAEGGEGGCSQEAPTTVTLSAPMPLHPGGVGGVGAAVPGRSRSPGPEQYRQVSSILGPKLYVVASGQGSPCMDFRWEMVP